MRRRYQGREIAAMRIRLAERDGYRDEDGTYRVLCCLCRQPIDMRLPGNVPAGPTIEHHRAFIDGGTNDADNLGLAHSACNKSRGRRAPTTLGPTSRKWL